MMAVSMCVRNGSELGGGILQRMKHATLTLSLAMNSCTAVSATCRRVCVVFWGMMAVSMCVCETACVCVCVCVFVCTALRILA